MAQLVFLFWVPQDAGEAVMLSGGSGEVAAPGYFLSAGFSSYRSWD